MTPLAVELTAPQYADAVAAHDYASLEATLNAANIAAVKADSYITELGILSLLGPTAGQAFLAGIEAAATVQPVLDRAIRWLRSDRGIDVGNAHVRTMIGQLSVAGVVTPASANAVLAVGSRTISRAEQLDLGIVGLGAIQNAIKEIEGN